MYLTYEEYKLLGGNADEAAFFRLEFLAESKINERTNNRIKDIDNAEMTSIADTTPLKMCMFELIEFYKKQDITSTGKQIISESNNGVSVAYGTSESQEIASQTENIIRSYLFDLKAKDGNSILFLGVRNAAFCE